VIGVGVVGLGFMGATHLGAYARAAEAGLGCRLVAVADASAERRAGRRSGGGNLASGADDRLFDPATVRAYEHPEQLFADPGVQLVSICTPTDTHVALATAAIKAGKHVLVEKPVAVRSVDAARLRDEARRHPHVKVLPAMVMRFWPGWAWLKEKVDSGEFGSLRSLYLERLGSRPAWNPGFYADAARSGGALVDLHIHDADFVLWLLGRPSEVVTTGTLEQMSTVYRFHRGPASVVATGGWGQQAGFGFRMCYLANFERATAEFDLARGDRPVLLSDAAGQRAVDLPTLGGYDAEVRHMLAVVRGDERPRCTLDDAVTVAHLLEAEQASMETGRAETCSG
jgi:predicted dehydrogenase